MDKAMKVRAIAALSIVAGSAFAEPVLVNDSISQFSGVQGTNGWYYGWYNNDAVSSSGAGLTANLEAFNQFSYFSGDYGWWASDPSSVGGEPSGKAPGSLAVATASLLHPNAPAGGANVVPDAQWGARRWVSDFSGDLTLHGHIAHYMYANAALGNGTEAYVLLDGVEVFSYIVEADDFDGVDFTLDLDVVEGSVIDLIVGARGDALYDATEFRVRMSGSVVPAPGALALVGLGGLMMGRRRR